MKFIDKVTIEVRAGSGGAGHCGFRREKYVPKGGPDGGNGGNGGNVTLIADSHLTTLLDFHYRRHFHAQNGAPGEKSRKTGRSGSDLAVRVPVGTVVRDANTKRLLGDLISDGQTFTLAHGGIGGRGNAEFKTSVNQAPRYAEPGRPGEEFMVELELKIIADVGLVGFPNAGKSTFISVISAAKPKIADYPFTTLTPNIGIARVGDEQSFSVADIPGLIEGAHLGKGLGIKFLRHIERTRLLVFLIDAASDDVERDYEILCNELAKHRGSLARKRRIVALSKVDTIDNKTRRRLENITFGEDKLAPMFLSSVVGEGVEAIKWAMWNTLQTAEEVFDNYDDEEEFEDEGDFDIKESIEYDGDFDDDSEEYFEDDDE